MRGVSFVTGDAMKVGIGKTAMVRKTATRQPLRFLLAADPGAGKTIMAGLLIKELFIRGSLKRCLIIAPGDRLEST